MWMLSEISARGEQAEAALGRLQREPQRNHREMSKEERDGEAGRGRRQNGEAERALQLRGPLGGFTGEERGWPLPL